jgi:hypothetical protein
MPVKACTRSSRAADRAARQFKSVHSRTAGEEAHTSRSTESYSGAGVLQHAARLGGTDLGSTSCASIPTRSRRIRRNQPIGIPRCDTQSSGDVPGLCLPERRIS